MKKKIKNKKKKQPVVVKESLDIGFENASDTAKKWWRYFEDTTDTRVVEKLKQELIQRNADLKEFFLAYVYSNIDNIQGNLEYMDYARFLSDEGQRNRSHSAVRSLILKSYLDRCRECSETFNLVNSDNFKTQDKSGQQKLLLEILKEKNLTFGENSEDELNKLI